MIGDGRKATYQICNPHTSEDQSVFDLRPLLLNSPTGISLLSYREAINVYQILSNFQLIIVYLHTQTIERTGMYCCKNQNDQIVHTRTNYDKGYTNHPSIQTSLSQQ